MRAVSMPASRAFLSTFERNSATHPPNLVVCEVRIPSHRRCRSFHPAAGPASLLFGHGKSRASVVSDSGGADALLLLQSLLTNDVEQAQPGGGVYALLLTPKGAVL